MTAQLPEPLPSHRALQRLHSLGASLFSLVLAAFLVFTGPFATALALSVNDLPAQAPASHLLDRADVLSRAGSGEIEKALEAFSAERVDARLITLTRLDYGLSLDDLAGQLLERWSQPSGDGASLPLLLLMFDTQTKATAVAAAPALQRQLPADLLSSTARTTMALPLREGDRYRQATMDGLNRLEAVLQGGEDPGEPVVEQAPVVASNIPSREETASSNAFTWVIVLLVIGSVVPMVTWWVFSR